MMIKRAPARLLALALIASLPGRALAQADQVANYRGPAGTYVGAQGVQIIGYDSVTGQPCVAGKTATCGVVSKPAGSIGIDYSVNAPTLPLVATTPGASFGGATAMSTWVLLVTVPASARNGIRISAPGGQRIAYIEDDGTAAIGTAPVNASIDFIDPGSGLYTQGGDQTLIGHSGRFSIYGPSGTFVQVRTF